LIALHDTDRGLDRFALIRIAIGNVFQIAGLGNLQADMNAGDEVKRGLDKVGVAAALCKAFDPVKLFMHRWMLMIAVVIAGKVGSVRGLGLGNLSIRHDRAREYRMSAS
jgi:hypothetical protein